MSIAFSMYTQVVFIYNNNLLPHKYMESTIQRKQETVICAKLLVNAVIFYIGAIR